MKITIPEQTFTITTTTTGTGMTPEELKLFGWDSKVKYVDNKYEQPCAILAFFERYPDEKSVCMTCTCPRCTVQCVSPW